MDIVCLSSNTALLIDYHNFPLNKSRMLSYFKLGLQNHVELQQQQRIDAHAIVQQSNNITKSIAFYSTLLKAFCLCRIIAHYDLCDL